MTLLQWTPSRKVSCGVPMSRKSYQRRNEVSSWYPATDIYDTESEYVFNLEVPGFAKDEINVEIKEGILTISGERKADEEAYGSNVHRAERRSGKFSRSFRLPKSVDGKNIKAKLHKGILELRIAKPEEQKTRTIPITFN